MVKELSKTEARQGNNVRMTTRVLLTSTLLALAVLTVIYFLFWPWPDPNTSPVEQPAGSDRAPESVQPKTPSTDQPSPQPR